MRTHECVLSVFHANCSSEENETLRKLGAHNHIDTIRMRASEMSLEYAVRAYLVEYVDTKISICILLYCCSHLIVATVDITPLLLSFIL